MTESLEDYPQNIDFVLFQPLANKSEYQIHDSQEEPKYTSFFSFTPALQTGKSTILKKCSHWKNNR